MMRFVLKGSIMSALKSEDSEISETTGAVASPTRTRSLVKGLAIVGLILLMVLPRFTALNQYIIVDESDRWLWAEDFTFALHRGDLTSTLIGHGYPGVVPAWIESAWIFMEAARRSLVEGQWVGEPGLYLIFHEWSRVEALAQQRLPIVALNTGLALAIVWAVWRLFGERVALLSGLLIALDPFYLSDSRVNRAEAVITGLMTLSVLALIFYYRERRYRYIIISGIFGGLSLLTKIQALTIAPAIALTGLLIVFEEQKRSKKYEGRSKADSPSQPPYSLLLTPSFLHSILKFGAIWIAAAVATWILLWPAMWVTPIETLAQVYDYATHMSGESGAHVFFLGQTFQDADPGWLFYPIVFLLRSTPLTLLGLAGFGVAVLAGYWNRQSRQQGGHAAISFAEQRDFKTKENAIFLIYLIVYALSISIGSHKQDRYLMPVFPVFNILAAMGLIYLWSGLKGMAARWNKAANGKKSYLTVYSLLPTSQLLNSWLAGWVLFSLLIIFQLSLILPHHPYYFSYFNPLFGGGQTAVRLLRIGWGEGMDQVGSYLAAKPNSHQLVVASRFAQYMPDFKGEVIALTTDGHWTRADYITLYIQQLQRNEEPSPAFFDYFRTRTPEKVIRLGDIDYAWIYPRPFAHPANPWVSRLSQKAALLGYSWERLVQHDEVGSDSGSPVIRLVWENLGLDDKQLVARLVGIEAQSNWAACLPAPNFVVRSRQTGAYVESLCTPTLADLPPGLYTVQFGLKSDIAASRESVESFEFPAGWLAAHLTTSGEIRDVLDLDRFEAIAAATIPTLAQRVDRIYDGRLRLAAYQLDPPQPKPGDSLAVTLYWQPIKPVAQFVETVNTDSWRTHFYEGENSEKKPVRLTVQLADSRSLQLGRVDTTLSTDTWHVGEVITTQYRFALASELDGPLAARLEIQLFNEAEVSVRATTLAGQSLDPVTTRFTIAPKTWPDLIHPQVDGTYRPVDAIWQGGLRLAGYALPAEPAQPGEMLPVTLFWQTGQPVTESYVAFIHLLDVQGQIVAQSDALPRAGAYPTPWWEPGPVIEDGHSLVLPEDLPAGSYRWVVGLYRQEDGARLGLTEGGDSFEVGAFAIE